MTQEYTVEEERNVMLLAWGDLLARGAISDFLVSIGAQNLTVSMARRAIVDWGLSGIEPDVLRTYAQEQFLDDSYKLIVGMSRYLEDNGIEDFTSWRGSGELIEL